MTIFMFIISAIFTGFFILKFIAHLLEEQYGRAIGYYSVYFVLAICSYSLFQSI